MITLLEFKTGLAQLPPPVYVSKPYLVLDDKHPLIVLAAGDEAYLRDLSPYYDACFVTARTQDLYLNDNTKINDATAPDPAPLKRTWQLVNPDPETGTVMVETVERGTDVPTKGYPIATVYTGPEPLLDPTANVIAALPEILQALEILIDHARERYPHFEGERGQKDIDRAQAALDLAAASWAFPSTRSTK